MALPVNGSTHLILAYYSIYRPRKNERLSWPSWLTYSGWFTHSSGQPSAAGRAQALVKVDRRIRWHYTTTILRLRIGARLTRYRNCKFHNFARTINRHADGISRYSVPPSAGLRPTFTPERRTGKVRRPETDVLPLCHATNMSIILHVFF